MKSGRQNRTISDPSAKDKSKKYDKTALEISVKGEGARRSSCRKSGTLAGKVSKQRRTTTESSVITSISTPNWPLEVSTPVGMQSLQSPKFQLQLFPMDDPTRKRLEENNHCPYLELTITTKKKIASVIRHLNMKWGNSRSALEELFLFPYNARVESLESYRRWTSKDSNITAAEVHAAIGKPAVFRLRYGWLNILEQKISNFSQTSPNLAKIQEKGVDDLENVPCKVSQECKPLLAESPLKQDALQTAPMKTTQAEDNLRPENDVKHPWVVDCVSSMSFGALYSKLETAEGSNLSRQASQKTFLTNSDSFDASIAAYMARYHTGNQSTTIAQPSILDAEETCNPFSFHKSTSLNKNCRVQSQVPPVFSASEASQNHARLNMLIPPVEELNTTLKREDDAQPIQEENNQLNLDRQGDKQEKEENQVDPNATDIVNNQFEGLDAHWPPSVSSWQFLPPQQIISSDSNGLSGFASTSLDIF
ncbi:TSL-kinase interacting protein 1-like isoform X2 [Phalaenopsis equestris]|nr:TSL-kinase interacting protein 1-like isoform X2 [Phalaenopsis equestris]